jgi:ubiquitin-protein ligase/ribosomal protein S27E
MSTIRLRRLAADHQKLSAYLEHHPRLALMTADGDPPERYVIEYRIRSLRQVGDDLREVSRHEVEIVLPRDYPRMAPQCRMLTPVFHPNIAPHAICVGDHWSAGEPIWGLVARIGEMLAWQSYNVKSPLNGEAARWAEQHRDELPLDPVSLLVDLDSPATAPARRGEEPVWEQPGPVPRSAATPNQPAAATDSARSAKAPPSAASSHQATGGPSESDAPQMAVQCPQCGQKYKLAGALAGKRVRCRQCQTILQIPEWGGDG